MLSWEVNKYVQFVKYNLCIVLSPVHTSNDVEATYDFVERIFRLVAFDNVASTMLLMRMGLYAAYVE